MQNVFEWYSGAELRYAVFERGSYVPLHFSLGVVAKALAQGDEGAMLQ
jgi:hypothetical protein